MDTIYTDRLSELLNDLKVLRRDMVEAGHTGPAQTLAFGLHYSEQALEQIATAEGVE